MAAGQYGRLGAPAVQLAAEDPKYARAAATVQLQPMAVQSVLEGFHNLNCVTTRNVQVKREAVYYIFVITLNLASFINHNASLFS